MKQLIKSVAAFALVLVFTLGSTLSVSASNNRGNYNRGYGNRSNYSYNQSTNTNTNANANTGTSTGITEAKAQAIFKEYYPGVSIQTTKLQDNGKVFYMFGRSGNQNYKMKVRVSDGTVVYNYPAAKEAVASDTKPATSAKVDETGARAVFAKHYPNVTIQTLKLQDNGKVFYMFGRSGNQNYKMKVRVSDGAVVYSYPAV